MANDNTPNGTPTPGGGGNDNHYESLNEFILALDTRLTNGLLPDVLPHLQKVGYQPTAITAKQAELEALKSLTTKQVKEYGDQYKAGDNYDKQLAVLQEDYATHVDLARIDFEDDAAALTTLGLQGKRKRARADYATQALLLYNGVLNNTDYAATLAASGIDTATLTAMRDGFLQLQALDKTQTAETGEAQKATADRDTAWDALEDWKRIFDRKAKIALKKYPQLREKLGMLER